MIVIGTAGHIDHGKTTLVKALTGIDTDRLQVERERGITTELGFTHLDLGDGRLVSIIDAPGHEKFVRHMIAGAGGLDLAILVVAADEGVMPQTREHLDILGLVGVRRGLVILTKCDLVDSDDRELAMDDLHQGLSGSFLENAEIMQFAAGRPQSHDTFRKEFISRLTEMFPDPPVRPVDRPLRIAIDRVFVMKGFGTVVTGTCTAGRIRVGDTATAHPDGPSSVVRGLQSNGMSVEEVSAGERVAVNFQGIEREQVARGQVLSTPGAIRSSSVLDVHLSLLPRIRRSLGRRTYTVVHVGTTQVDGTVVLLDREELLPSDSCVCQLRLTRSVTTLSGDPFIIRGFESLSGYGKTLGGGRILHPEARPHKANDRATLQLLNSLHEGDDREGVLAAVELSGQHGVTVDDLLAICRPGKRSLSAVLGSLLSAGDILPFKKDQVTHYLGSELSERLGLRILSALADIHARRPDQESVSAEEMSGALPDSPDPIALKAVLGRLSTRGQVVETDGLFRHPDHVSSLEQVSEESTKPVLDVFQRSNLSTPSTEQAAQQLGRNRQDVVEAVNALVRSGSLIRIDAGNLIFPVSAIVEAGNRLTEFLRSNGSISMSQFKELLGVSRKYAIPLAEYFDARRITLRMPDGTRKLRKL